MCVALAHFKKQNSVRKNCECTCTQIEFVKTIYMHFNLFRVNVIHTETYNMACNKPFVLSLFVHISFLYKRIFRRCFFVSFVQFVDLVAANDWTKRKQQRIEENFWVDLRKCSRAKMNYLWSGKRDRFAAAFIHRVIQSEHCCVYNWTSWVWVFESLVCPHKHTK